MPSMHSLAAVTSRSKPAVKQGGGGAARAGGVRAVRPAGDSAADALEHVPPPSVVVVDPARRGLSASVREYLLACGADRVVYVSCNPMTLARDLAVLTGAESSGGSDGSSAAAQGSDDRGRAGSGSGSRQSGRFFEVTHVQPVDLFPHTDHVECVVALRRTHG